MDHPDDLPAVKKWLRRTIEFEEPHEVQQRLRRWDGEYRWFQPRSLPLREAGGRITRWFAVLNDIEDLRRAKEATLAREAAFRQIVNTLPGMIATMKATGEVEFVNDRILEYTGWPPERFFDWRPLVHLAEVVSRNRGVRKMDEALHFEEIAKGSGQADDLGATNITRCRVTGRVSTDFGNA